MHLYSSFIFIKFSLCLQRLNSSLLVHWSVFCYIDLDNIDVAKSIPCSVNNFQVYISKIAVNISAKALNSVYLSSKVSYKNKYGDN